MICSTFAKISTKNRSTDGRLSRLKPFSQGDYAKITDIWDDNPELFEDEFSRTLVVGALCLSGKRWDAEEIDRDLVNPFGRRFFVGLALTRESLYAEAEKVFEENRRQLKGSTDTLGNFFVWQGLGFFQFFRGHYGSLSESAERAYRAALRAKFTWGQAVALDLLAHGAFQQGKVQEAFGFFEQATGLARKLNARHLTATFEISKLCFESQNAVDPRRILSKLRKVEESMPEQDAFARNALRLEIFRQLIHQGEFDEARALFMQISPGFYQSKNRRQIATLVQRYAHMVYLQGGMLEALTLVRSGRLNLNSEMDPIHLLRLYGLENQIIDAGGRSGQLPMAASSETKLLRAKIVDLTASCGSMVSHRILRRLGDENEEPAHPGQDSLGDLLDLVKTAPDRCLHEMIKNGLWGLIPPTFEWASNSSRVILDVEGERALLQIGAWCRLSAKPIRGYSRKLLEHLVTAGPATRQQLIENIWGYRYESERHDRLIIATLGHLRQQLGSSAVELVRAQDLVYSLAMPVLAWNETFADGFVDSSEESSNVLPVVVSVQPRPAAPSDFAEEWVSFNHRQIKLLRGLRSGQEMTIKVYQKRFQVSHMTAFRDLKELAEKSILRRVGRGRATCYLRE